MAPPRTLLLLATLCLLASAAHAHTTVTTDDDKYRIVAGQLNEPVVTYAKTGLDLCFTTNDTARTPVTVNAGNLTATIVAPDGQTLTQPLRTQFGRAGCYQFQEPYVLTEPGQYNLTLTGTVLDSAVDLKGVAAGGAVVDLADIQFPSEPATAAALQAELAALRAQVTALQSQVDGMKQTHDDGHTSRSAAGPAALFVLVSLAGVAMLARRQA